MPEICLRYPWDMPDTSVRYPWETYEIPTRYPWDTHEIRVAQNFWNLINIISPELLSVLDHSKTQKHKDLVHRTDVHIALSTYIIQRKFWKIQRKILKVSILTFYDIIPPHGLFNGTNLHSWGPDTSFDTHMAISMYDICWMAFASNMAFLAFLT